MSLDGQFEGESPWDLHFHQSVWGEDLQAISLQQATDMDMLLFGRKTYEGMKRHWETATGDLAAFMNAVQKRVASHTLEKVTWRNSAIIGTDVVSFLRAAKNEAGKNVYVFGSANLLDTLLEHGLVDECRACIAPVVLGSGTPLFKPGRNHRFKLLEARALTSGGIFTRYSVDPGRVDSVQRFIKAPAAAIYAALVDPNAMTQWRPPAGMKGKVLEIDPREGGRFRMALHYGDTTQSGKSGDGSDVFESRFICLELNREVTEAIAFQTDNPAFSGTMTMSTRLRSIGDGTEISIIAKGVPEGVGQEDHLAGLVSTLENLEHFILSEREGMNQIEASLIDTL